MKNENNYREIDLEAKAQNERKYLRAKKRVEELKKFYDHLMSFILVNAFLAGLNYYSNQWDYPWFLWPLFGWGIGLAFHAMSAFQVNPLFNKNWEEKKIREFMEEEESGDRKRWE